MDRLDLSQYRTILLVLVFHPRIEHHGTHSVTSSQIDVLSSSSDPLSLLAPFPIDPVLELANPQNQTQSTQRAVRFLVAPPRPRTADGELFLLRQDPRRGGISTSVINTDRVDADSRNGRRPTSTTSDLVRVTSLQLPLLISSDQVFKQRTFFFRLRLTPGPSCSWGLLCCQLFFSFYVPWLNVLGFGSY